MTAIFFAILAYVGWGTGDIFGTIASRKAGAYNTSFWTWVVSIFIFSLYLPFAAGQFGLFSPAMLWLTIGLALLLTLSLVTFNEALRIGNPTIVGTISGSFLALVVVLSIIFLGESLTLYQGLVIGLIFLGVVLTSLNIAEFRKIRLDKAVVLSLTTMVGWGIYFTFIKLPVEQVGWFFPTYIPIIVSIVAMVVANIFFRQIRPLNHGGAVKYFFLNSLFIGGATFAFNYAASIGNIAIIAPIAGAYPTLFAVLSYLIFKEPVNRQQWLGIVLTLLGIVALSVISS